MGRGRALLIALLTAALVLTGIAVPADPASAAIARETAVQQILADTNAIRAQLGMQPLLRNTSLDAVAQNWTQKQANDGDISHNGNLGSQIPSGWTWAGENVAAGYTYRTVVAAWKASEGHYENMISSQYTDIGIGYVERNGTAYFTQDFARYSRPGPAAAVPSPTPASAPIPKVQGNQLIDARTGDVWVPHGVNWPSFEYACQQGWGYTQGGATDAAATAMASWGIDLVRLPLNEQCWLGAEGNPHYGSTAGYRAAVRAFVDILNAHGIAVILDLHWTAPPGMQADGQRAMTSTRSVLFWQSVAAAYKSVPAVIFDAFNEPYSRGPFQLTWPCWRNGGCSAPAANDQSAVTSTSFTVAGMQSLVTTIRKAGAAQPIMLAGIDYANDLRGWVANKPNDGQLIASWHNYPGQRCQTVSCWNSEIVPVAEVAPVIMSEFGQVRRDPYVDDLTPRMEWADAHGIGYLPWAWWVVDAAESESAALYALIADDDFTPKEPAGTTLFAHLAELTEPKPAPPAPGREGSGPAGTPVGTPGVRTPVGALAIEDRGAASSSAAAMVVTTPAPQLKRGLWVEHQLKSLD